MPTVRDRSTQNVISRHRFCNGKGGLVGAVSVLPAQPIADEPPCCMYDFVRSVVARQAIVGWCIVVDG